MRSALASIVAAGVLAIGAVPATLALADEDAGKGAAGRDGAGPPSWATAHGHDKTKQRSGDRGADKAAAHALKKRQQAAWPEDAQGPPPWAKAHGKQGKQGRAHAKAMQKWERCVAKADPAVTCAKPTPPGRTS